MLCFFDASTSGAYPAALLGITLGILGSAKRSNKVRGTLISFLAWILFYIFPEIVEGRIMLPDADQL